MKITKSQLKQIIKEELQEMQEFDPTQELAAQGLSRDETLYYEPEEDDEFPPETRVRFRDNLDITGVVKELDSEHPYIGTPGKSNKFYRVVWDYTPAFQNARHPERPRGPGRSTVTDERLLVRDEDV